MKRIEQLIEEKSIEAVKAIFKVEEVSSKQIQVQKTRKEFKGDMTLVVFPFTRLSKSSPEETGQIIGNYLIDHVDEIIGFNVVKGFLNLEITPRYWLSVLKHIANSEDYGHAEKDSKETVMVEYSSPNTNKPLHLGHLRNNFLGWSVSEILKANGNKVIKVQVINDRGIHICKSMLAWKKWGNGETPESSGKKGDKLVGEYYVKFEEWSKNESVALLNDIFHQLNFFKDPEKDMDIKLFSFSSTLAFWRVFVENLVFTEKDLKHDKNFNTTPPHNWFVDLNNNFKSIINDINDKESLEVVKRIIDILNRKIPQLPSFQAQMMLRKWEAKDPEIYELWKTMNGWVYEGFEQTYQTMGVDFDKLYYESNTFLSGKEEVVKGLEQGVFFKKEDGSVWCDLTPDGLDEKLVLRSDGTAVYMTQDIGTAILRYREFPDLSGIIYTVGNEQDYHFKVLFLILEKLGFEWAKNCHHLSYGMVDLPTGKMKSREGTVVDADDLMEEMFNTALEKTAELGKVEDMENEEKLRLYRQIGLGALKYFLLKVDPKKQMMFNPEESVDFNGNTGPFIQYTHARISSLQRKYKSEISSDVSLSYPLHDDEKAVITKLYEYPEMIAEAAKQHSPAIIANYIYDLVKQYNQFYQAHPILKHEEKTVVDFRMLISKECGKIISSALWLLGIESPERM